MGRRRTGACTTREAIRIELSYLLREGYIKKGWHIKGFLSWTNGSWINIESKYTKKEKFLKLVYTLTDSAGIKHELNYRITLQTKPSNLGKGDVLYFICPQTKSPCRTLYRAYGSCIWKSRKSYQDRIYYPLQLSSKLSKYNDKYWEIDRELKILSSTSKARTYKGRPSKRAIRIMELKKLKSKMDMLRWSSLAMPKALRLALEGVQ